jgi:5-(carboxyamino)imidazole ribonucleotide mutase
VSVAVVMGSDSDWSTMRPAAEMLSSFGVDHDVRVVSAHRDPLGMVEFAQRAETNGFSVIIAGAGGAAHLPGMIASLTTLPVIGVPVPRPQLAGMDSLLSIVQMPTGIPVATVAVGGAANAALLALRILGRGDGGIAAELRRHQESLRTEVATRHAAVVDEWKGTT